MMRGDSDSETTVQELRAMVREFVDERDWRKYHAPKNITMALTIEAAELMEHFQWMGVEDSRDLSGDPETLSAVAEELSDVLCYGLALANELGLDVASSMRAKMEKNRRKYPLE
jgi:NTP pyrophosphatase (non-canonical NTP hydrolase)